MDRETLPVIYDLIKMDSRFLWYIIFRLLFLPEDRERVDEAQLKGLQGDRILRVIERSKIWKTRQLTTKNKQIPGNSHQ